MRDCSGEGLSQQHTLSLTPNEKLYSQVRSLIICIHTVLPNAKPRERILLLSRLLRRSTLCGTPYPCSTLLHVLLGLLS